MQEKLENHFAKILYVSFLENQSFKKFNKFRLDKIGSKRIFVE